MSNKQALSLISGGLDSLLATKLILEQGLHVEGINFFTGFTGDNNLSIKSKSKVSKISYNAKWVCDQLGIKLHVVDVVEKFRRVLLHPKYGYGANLNPCLDCKLFMIEQAMDWLEKYNFDFLITGEVLGQRPKSQRKDTLPIATKITLNKILRPLSAKLLQPTFPEKNGWINRDLLCGFNGRSRKPQFELAKKFNFKELPQPAGGCVLTDKNFCNRLTDFLNHNNQVYKLDDILLLQVGRHFRINKNIKVIVGRDEIENNFILSNKNYEKNIKFQSVSHPGAIVVVDGEDINNQNLDLIAKLAAYFSKGRNCHSVDVLVSGSFIDNKKITVAPFLSDNILQKWHI